MNVTNPPVFDHIVAFGAGSWVPFQDAYTINNSNPGAAGKFVIGNTPFLRDYSLCKGVTALIQDQVGNEWIHSTLHPNVSSFCIIVPLLDYGSQNVHLEQQCIIFVAALSATAYNIRVSGWAPAP